MVVTATAIAIGSVLIVPSMALAQESGVDNVGENLGDTLRGFAEPVLFGVMAIVAMFFLIQRKYSELAIWVGASLLVGWLVLSPDVAAEKGREFVDSLLGGG